MGWPIAVTVMPDSTRTAAEAAAACGCTVSQIVKSLIFKGKDSERSPTCSWSPAPTASTKRRWRRPSARQSSARTPIFVRNATGFAIGGIPPFGHVVKLPTFFDADLLQYGTVWAAAGTPGRVFAVDPGRLRDALVPTVIRVG